MKKITVIVLIYNNTLKAILKTLNSIVKQEFEEYEVILADDFSKNQYWNEIEKFFIENNFEDYYFIKNQENLGTVKNYLNAALKASGKYIKPIGAGDLLFDQFVLKRIYDFLEENHYNFGAGLLKSYCIGKDGFAYENKYKAPLDLKPYINNNYKKIKNNIALKGDYISGAAMFGETKFIISYLEKLADIVRLTEDIMQILIVLDGKQIPLLNEYVVFYEVGSGVSTKTKNYNKKDELTVDQEKFWEYVKVKYASNTTVLRHANKLLKIFEKKGNIRKNIAMIFLDFSWFRLKTIRKYQRKKIGKRIQKEFIA